MAQAYLASLALLIGGDNASPRFVCDHTAEITTADEGGRGHLVVSNTSRQTGARL